jgi:hypothetical protein
MSRTYRLDSLWHCPYAFFTGVIVKGVVMNAYHQEQIEAIAMVHKHLKSNRPSGNGI